MKRTILGKKETMFATKEENERMGRKDKRIMETRIMKERTKKPRAHRSIPRTHSPNQQLLN
jgi:hypothetical protein